jgi:hypothetical protein
MINRIEPYSQITKGQISSKPLHRLPVGITEQTLEHIKNVFASFSETESKKNQDLVHFKIDVGILRPQIKQFLDSRLYELIHEIFSKIYPQMSDEELQVLTIFSSATETSVCYTNAHRHFDTLLKEYQPELFCVPFILEKEASEYIAERATQLLVDELDKAVRLQQDNEKRPGKE